MPKYQVHKYDDSTIFIKAESVRVSDSNVLIFKKGKPQKVKDWKSLKIVSD